MQRRRTQYKKNLTYLGVFDSNFQKTNQFNHNYSLLKLLIYINWLLYSIL